MYRAIVLCGLLLPLVACTKTVPLQKEYAGPVPVTVSDGAKVRFDLTMLKNDGTAYEPNVIAVVQYQAIARSALTKGGYTLDPDASMGVEVRLAAPPGKNIIDWDTHAVENFAMGMVSFGTTCRDFTSIISAQGHVKITKAGAVLKERDIDIYDTKTDCFGGVSGKPLADRPEWQLRHYEGEIHKHIASWLQIVLNVDRDAPTGTVVTTAEPQIVTPPPPAAMQIAPSSQPIIPDVAIQPNSLTSASVPMQPATRPIAAMPIEPTVPATATQPAAPMTGNVIKSALPTLSASATGCPPPATVQPAGLLAGSQTVLPASTAKFPPTQEGTVDLWRAERVADRFRILHRLAADGLLESQRYNAWARQNAGAFLLTTAPPPVVGLSHQMPSYEQIVDFWRAADSHIPVVAAAERKTLVELLMPIDGPRAPVVRPPLEGAGIQRWFALLDRIRDEALLPAESIEAEKLAIEEARRQAGL